MEEGMAGQIAELRRPPMEQSTVQVEIIDSKELAGRLKLPKTWIEEACRTRTTDPIPHLKFGKYTRFRWGSRELTAWLERRASKA
jgi:hypothetical protein